jgi:hypothetical protein
MNAAQAGSADDKRARMNNFITFYCDVQDSDNALNTFCGDAATNNQRFNADISFARTFDQSPSLNINIRNPDLRNEEQSLMALAYHLYQHEIPERATDLGTRGIGNQNHILYQRSYQALNSLAFNSFAAQAALKAQSAQGAAPSIRALLTGLGMENTATARGLGTNPSYDAQMEVLTKRLYQDPQFLINLTGTRANLGRQNAMMDSIDVMQDRDIYNAILRSELLLSALVDLEARKQIDPVLDRLQ